MALDKPGLITTLTAVFSDVSPSSTPAQKAQAIADAVEAYVLTATVAVTIPVGTVSQGTSPAVAPNVAPIPLTGNLS